METQNQSDTRTLQQPLQTNAVSISFRFQRVTVEDTYVSVLVTDDLINEQADGSGRLDVPALVTRSVQLGQSSSVVRTQEEQSVTPHPIQQAPPGVGIP